MTEPAIVRSVDDVLRLVNERAELLGLRREDIDYLAGLASGHAGKLLSVPPQKRPAPATVFLLAGAVGYGVALVEDASALRAAKKEARNRKLNRPKAVQWRNAKALSMMHEEAVKRGKMGGSAAAAKMKPEQRSKRAKRAARARWRKPRIVELTGSTLELASCDMPSTPAVSPRIPARDTHRRQSAGNGEARGQGTAQRRRPTGRPGAMPS